MTARAGSILNRDINSSLKNLKEFISNEFSLPVELANPFSNIELSDKKEEISELAPSLAVATGLALRQERDTG